MCTDILMSSTTLFGLKADLDRNYFSFSTNNAATSRAVQGRCSSQLNKPSL